MLQEQTQNSKDRMTWRCKEEEKKLLKIVSAERGLSASKTLSEAFELYCLARKNNLKTKLKQLYSELEKCENKLKNPNKLYGFEINEYKYEREKLEEQIKFINEFLYTYKTQKNKFSKRKNKEGEADEA